MSLEGPNGPKAKLKTVLSVKAKGNAKRQGMTEGFFESEDEERVFSVILDGAEPNPSVRVPSA